MSAGLALDTPGFNALDALIRLLEHRDRFDANRDLLDAVVQQSGLYPYIQSPDEGNLRDQVVREFHRPEGLDEYLFHREQYHAYDLLLSGRNVVLSAPTSFGKSLIIDALVASGNYDQILIIVPTLALIDETRRRLSRFAGDYKIVTQSDQARGTRNLFILTQERVLQRPDLDDVDLLIVDEFYKMNLWHGPRGRGSADRRSIALNTAVYRVLNNGPQYFFLGPNIENFQADLLMGQDFTFIHTDYKTVASLTHRVAVEGDKLAALLELLGTLDGPTLIYCRSPKSARHVADAIAAARDAGNVLDEQLAWAVDWLEDNYHPEWTLAKALPSKVGLHTGRVPRSIASYVVRAFERGHIDILVCTSTLIEGVNTAAKNVVIFDKKIANRNLDSFTFKNICGRAGRMLQHYTGHVYLFYDPPPDELPSVIPEFEVQDEDTPAEVLCQLDPDDVPESYRDKLAGLAARGVPLEILKANVGLNLEGQLEFVHDILEQPTYWHNRLGWRGTPSPEELTETTDLILEHLMGVNRTGVFSGAQFRFFVNSLTNSPSLRDWIDFRIENDNRGLEASELIDRIFRELRNGFGFELPNLFRAASLLQKHAFEASGLAPGDYSFFATRIERLLQPPGAQTLEEYGIPFQLAGRLLRGTPSDATFDEVLERLMDAIGRATDLHPFEQVLLTDALPSLRASFAPNAP